MNTSQTVSPEFPIDENAIRIPYDKLKEFMGQVFKATGLPDDDAEKLAQAMADGDLLGKDSHGCIRVPMYINRIKGGAINKTPDIRITKKTSAMALVDGDNGMGHLVARFSMELAMDMASENGISWVGLQHSNHAGAAAVYASMATERDQIGIIACVGSANHAAPYGGSDILVGTNPIAVAIPTLDEPPVVIDMATTNSSLGKIMVKAMHNESMPEGWVIDDNGKPITDSKLADDGILTHIGGAKGFGLSMVIGFLAGTLNGAAFGSDVVHIGEDPHTETNTGQFIMALDVAHFMDPKEFKANVDRISREMVNSARLPGVDEIRMPGTNSFRIYNDRKANGIPITAPLLKRLNDAADEVNVPKLV
ncbi:MAG: lactate dehydrogenase [Alphaproteobacteria bacterium]|jgi:L-2-hydroxycarboxylate dehydrogenase (NAD+)|nr:lactate dehydrogenase [Alphaproteobacteria bacterium]PPR13773.1 MAG: putative oxidoreductase YjmC [Alphaproteobacteria bacterium MarineAlpha12_Bin1]|tara:strand:+ start:6632 stop:7726 length:1095 start_codon:yes stop_codon:yes gene_type:complete